MKQNVDLIKGNYRFISSIPTDTFVIPQEKLVQAQSKGFGASQARFQDNQNKLIQNLIGKYSNIKVVERKTLTSESDMRSIRQKMENKTQSLNNSFTGKIKPKKKVHYIIPQYRAGLLQVQEKVFQDQKDRSFDVLNQQIKQKNEQKKKSNIHFRGLSFNHYQLQNYMKNQNNQSTVDDIKHLNEEKMWLAVQQNKNLNIQQQLSNIQTNNQEIIATPKAAYEQQNNNNKYSRDYKRSYNSSFKAQSRETLFLLEYEKKQMQPGSANYEIKRIFENNIEKNYSSDQQKRLLNKQKDKDNANNQETEKNGQDQAVGFDDGIELAKQKISNLIGLKNQIKEEDELSENEQRQKDEFQAAHYQSISQNANKNKNKMQFMFMKDDRDRFGDQIYPLVLKDKTPGPGAYQINNHTLEKQKQVLRQQEDQKKLLKIWLHPDKEIN